MITLVPRTYPLCTSDVQANQSRLRAWFTRQALRKLWLKVHLYLGLFAGALFVLVSLTGSFLVFHKAIDEWLNPVQLHVTGTGSYRPLQEIISVARAAHPILTGPDVVIPPSHPGRAAILWFKVPTGKADHFRLSEVAVDPYSAQVLGVREWGNYLVSFIHELHRSFLIEKTGETIVGILALLLLTSVGTGLYLWWLGAGGLRQAFRLTRTASVLRWHYDFHRFSGVASAAILIILAGTGVYLEFPQYVVPLVRLFSPVEKTPPSIASIPRLGLRMLSPDEAVAIASSRFPDSQLKAVQLPNGPTGVYRVEMRQPGEIQESYAQSQAWIDPYTGDVLQVLDWRQFSAGETFVAWLFPIHNGEAFGLPGRLTVFVAGIAPLILYATALRMWWVKRQARRRQQGRPSQARFSTSDLR